MQLVDHDMEKANTLERNPEECPQVRKTGVDAVTNSIRIGSQKTCLV